MTAQIFSGSKRVLGEFVEGQPYLAVWVEGKKDLADVGELVDAGATVGEAAGGLLGVEFDGDGEGAGGLGGFGGAEEAHRE